MINFRYVMMSAASVFAMLYFGTGTASAQPVVGDLCYPVPLICNGLSVTDCTPGASYEQAVARAIIARKQTTGVICSQPDPPPIFEPTPYPNCELCNSSKSAMKSYSIVPPCPSPASRNCQIILSVCFSNGESNTLYGVGSSTCEAVEQAKGIAGEIAQGLELQICSWCFRQPACIRTGCAPSPSYKCFPKKVRKRNRRLQRYR